MKRALGLALAGALLWLMAELSEFEIVWHGKLYEKAKERWG